MPTGYRVPTNYKLVSNADLIVVGTLIPDVKFDRNKLDAWPTLRVRPVKVLKGQLPKAPLIIEGVLNGYEHGARANPVITQLDEVHPSALFGSCSREIYASYAPAVLMFRKQKGGFVQYAPAFSRAAEDVGSTATSPWVKAIGLYQRVQALPVNKRRASLLSLQKQLRSSDRASDRMIADDINHALNPSYPQKADLTQRMSDLTERLRREIKF
jgi:hypothetical protein